MRGLLPEASLELREVRGHRAAAHLALRAFRRLGRRMSQSALIAVVLAYFALVFWIAHRTGRGATNEGFFVGNRASPWPVVAFG
jgi:hypothetical protein